MLSRLKRALVESYVGAIALGWLLADIVFQIAGVFAIPVASWVQRSEFGKIAGRGEVPAGFLFRDSAPALVRSVLLLMIWYLLMRWLYMAPLDHEAVKETAQPVTPIHPN